MVAIDTSSVDTSFNFGMLQVAPASAKESTVVDVALKCLNNGFSVLPIRSGTKIPRLKTWGHLQENPMTEDEVKRSFVNGCNIALICGAVSGNLEDLDIDKPELFQPFLDTLKSLNPELWAKLTVWQETCSGAFGILYRVTGSVGGSTKLARSASYKDENGKFCQDTYIETKGEGGFFLIEPSKAVPKQSTPSQPIVPNAYTLYGNLESLPVISGEERDLLHAIARSFDEAVKPEPHVPASTTSSNGDRPGDRFNREAEWHSLLEGYGWQYAKTIGDREHWTRPGKPEGSTSATLHPEKGLFVFSTSTPLPDQKPLDKFAVYTHYAHNGNFIAAARALAERYGLNINNVKSTALTRKAATKAKKRSVCQDIPDHLLNPGGLISEFIDYTERSCAVAVPTYSLAAIIALLGTLAGHKVTISGTLYTNFYNIVLGESGTGKDSPQKAMFHLANRELILMKYLCPGDIASDAALNSRIAEEPITLLVIDEIGHFLRAVKESRMAHLARIVFLFLQLFSSPNRPGGRNYADRKWNTTYRYSHLGIYGSTTPSTFFGSLSCDDVEDGFLPRALFFADDSPPKRPKRIISKEGTEELAAKLAAIANIPLVMARNGVLDEGVPIPYEMPVEHDAQELADEFSESCHELKLRFFRDSTKGPIYNRLFEHGMKLTLIHAISRCGAGVLNGVITVADIKWGTELAKHLIHWAAEQLEYNMLDGDFDQSCRKIIEVMENDMHKGRTHTTWKTITSKVRRHDRITLNKIIDILELRGDIIKTPHEYQPGKTVEVFQLAEGYSG